LGIGVHSASTSTVDSSRNIPVQAIGLTTGCRYVNTGAQNTYVVKDNQLYTFGNNFAGQLGLNIADSSRNIPQLVSSLTNVTAVHCGSSHTLVLSNGQVYGFGLNASGQLGNGTTVDASRNITQPIGMTSGIRGMSANGIASIVIKDGNIYQFGINPITVSPVTTPTYLQTDTSAVRLVNMPPAIPINLVGGTVSSSNSINYGQSLQNIGISYTGNFRDLYTNSIITGTLSWMNPSIIPNVGSSQTWIFTPDDINYDTMTGSTVVTINKATPIQDVAISVSNINYGQTLSTAGLTGTFKHPTNNSPVSGILEFILPSIIPSVGTDSYSWRFRPDASNNYSNVTGSVSITVNYVSDNTSLNDIISNVITPQDTSASIVVTSAVFDANSYLTPSAYIDPSQSTITTKVYTTDVSFSFVPASVPQNATVTTNPYRDISYNLELTDLSSGYNLIITPVHPAYFVSPEPTKTVNFAFAYRVIDVATGGYVTTLQYPITTFVEVFEMSKYNYTIYHLDTSTGIVSPVSYNISGDIIEFTITKNNVLFGTSTPILNTNPNPATITLPFVFDLSAQSITMLGESIDPSTLDASFNLTVDMSASIFQQSFRYRDSDICGNVDISFTPLANSLEYEINRLNSTANDKYSLTLSAVTGYPQINYTQFSRSKNNISPSNGPLNQHFIQYISSLMFGHPQAQAPIKNDAAIIADLSNGNLGSQFVTSMTDASDIRHSMLEQLFASDVSGDRFDLSDNDGPYYPYPFMTGDKIVFRVSMSGNIFEDSPTIMTNGTISSNAGILYRLFNGIPGISFNPNPVFDRRYWKVIITLI
jgi:hypothetical protein